MNRIDRLSAILIQLQTKKLIRANEIAERFEISLRTVYRDMRALEEAGVPLGAEAGKGYYIVDGFHLPPVMFTKDEAGALLIAEKLVQKMADKSVREHFLSAAHKIKSVLPDQEKDYLDDLNSMIQVYFNEGIKPVDFPNSFITTIQEALVENLCLTIDYYVGYKNEMSENRTIEPVGLVFYGMVWHLIGFCKLRNDYRDFRVDRIKNMIKTDCQFTPRSKQGLQDYFKHMQESFELKLVVVNFKKNILHTISSAKYYFGFLRDKPAGEYIEMQFAVTDYEYIAKWLLSFGDNIEIVKPKELKELMKELIKNLYDYYL